MNKPLTTLLSIVLCCSYLSATTVLYIITPSGMVIAADGQIEPVRYSQGRFERMAPSRTTKIVLLRKRFAFTSIGIQSAGDTKGTVLYHFPAFAKLIESRIRHNMTVDSVADVVRKQAEVTFSFANGNLDHFATRATEVPNGVRGSGL
jgi:hypothetical protein